MLKATLLMWLMFPLCMVLLGAVELWARKLGVKCRLITR